MICENCGSSMSYGAPHCETIKIQYECQCGNIQCEYYTPEEMQVNELTATTGASLKDCRQALENNGFDLAKAEAALNHPNKTKRIMLKKGCRYQTETSVHQQYEDVQANATEIFSNGELVGYRFETEFVNGVTHDLGAVNVL